AVLSGWHRVNEGGVTPIRRPVPVQAERPPCAGRWRGEPRRRGSVGGSVAVLAGTARSRGGATRRPARYPGGVGRCAVLWWTAVGGSRQGGRPTEAEAAWT